MPQRCTTPSSVLEASGAQELGDVPRDVVREQHADVTVRQHDVIGQARDLVSLTPTVPSLISSKRAKN
jgi:hypothetical protein